MCPSRAPVCFVLHLCCLWHYIRNEGMYFVWVLFCAFWCPSCLEIKPGMANLSSAFLLEMYIALLNCNGKLVLKTIPKSGRANQIPRNVFPGRSVWLKRTFPLFLSLFFSARFWEGIQLCESVPGQSAALQWGDFWVHWLRTSYPQVSALLQKVKSFSGSTPFCYPVWNLRVKSWENKLNGDSSTYFFTEYRQSQLDFKRCLPTNM